MPRKLRTFQTSIGFFDLAIAAPSMKAALEAWGANSNLFQQGFASEVDDPEIVAAAMAKPGVVLRRAVGTKNPFKENAELPTRAVFEKAPRPTRTRSAIKKKSIGHTGVAESKAERRALIAFKKEEAVRKKAREKAEAAEEARRARRAEAVTEAELAISAARMEHEANLATLNQERAAVQRRTEEAKDAWEKQKQKLEKALRHAREE